MIPTLAANCFDAPTSALLMSMTRPTQRGAAYAFFHCVGGLVAGLGPWLVGRLSDAFGEEGGAGSAAAGGDVSGGLQSALTVTQLINLWAALHFVLAARALRAEAAAAAVATPRGTADE